MAPRSLPSCGFAVQATKKGELPFKTEKRARGKKVTIISNVVGEASKLARTLQSVLGVGGTARHADKDTWAVEVQGDQTARVFQVLDDMKCLQGVSSAAMEAARGQGQTNKAEVSVVSRTAATKFLAQSASPEEERRRALEMEAAFYSEFWQTCAAPSDDFDFSDVWDDRLTSGPEASDLGPAAPAPSLEEVNVALRDLGMFAESGKAVREFWETSGMTIQQFRKMALNPGARLVTDAPGRKKAPSNLISRQKMSDWRSGRARGSYFAAPVSAIDNYERGIAKPEMTQETEEEAYQEPKMVVKVDSGGWNSAELSYCTPLTIPTTRLDDDERSIVARKCLQRLEETLGQQLDEIQQKIPGVKCRLDCDTFGMDVILSESDFLYAGRPEAAKPKDKPDKEEMRLEKKLREICTLRRKQLDGETIDKLQAEKVAKRGELFQEVAEMKLRRAEKEILRVFKRHQQSFQSVFWDLEWQALYGDERSTASGGSAPSVPFGTFDTTSCDGAITISPDGLVVESCSPRWVSARLHLGVLGGEVGAFAVEVLELGRQGREGHLRFGWASADAKPGELGMDAASFGYGAKGKRCHNGGFEDYGEAFGVGDVIHCEVERDPERNPEERVQVGFAKNSEALGVAFALHDAAGASVPLLGAICGKGFFKVRLVSAESMPLEEAPGLEGFVQYDEPQAAVAIRDFVADGEDVLQLWSGETVYVSSDDGEGWLFGFFLDPDDPEDGGWFPKDAVQFLDPQHGDGTDPWATDEDAASAQAWHQPPLAASDDWDAPAPAAAAGGAAVARGTVAVPAAAVAPAAPGVPGSVEGLDGWLKELSLRKYEEKVLEWCSEMGAVSLEELWDNWQDLADALGLKPLERKRLERAAAAR